MNRFARTLTARLCMAATALLGGNAALADTDTGNLTVTATVANQCAIGDATLALGTISLINANGTIGTPSGSGITNVPWACTNGTSATVVFGNGLNYNAHRRLVSTTAGSSNQFLAYNLKQGTSSGADISGTPIALTGADGTNRTFAVWGGPADTPENRTVKPATDYTDTVQMTITFTP